MYTIDHIFPVITIKHLADKYVEATMPHKLAMGTKPSVSNLRVLFYKCVVWKATLYVDTNALNMCHQSQKGFCGIFVGIPQHQEWYPVYVPST